MNKLFSTYIVNIFIVNYGHKTCKYQASLNEIIKHYVKVTNKIDKHIS